MTRSLIAGLCLMFPAAALAAPEAGADPWAKVPRLPTACYSSRDNFWEETGAAIEAMQQEIYRQKEVNAGLSARLNEMDPMEKQSRMQTFLMENPQDAMKLMQAAQSQGAAAEGDVTKDNENEQALQEDLKQIQARYDAALEKTVGPLVARLRSFGETGLSAAQIAEAKSLVQRMNAEYERVCPEWYGASGLFHVWLTRYKTHKLQNHIPYVDELERGNVVQFKIFGVPAESFRTTVTMETVVEYMKKAMMIFGDRWTEPRTGM